MKLEVRAREAEGRCPFCHDALAADAEAVTSCDRCAASLHPSCAAELRGCPLVGCGGRLTSAKDERTERWAEAAERRAEAAERAAKRREVGVAWGGFTGWLAGLLLLTRLYGVGPGSLLIGGGFGGVIGALVGAYAAERAGAYLDARHR